MDDLGLKDIKRHDRATQGDKARALTDDGTQVLMEHVVAWTYAPTGFGCAGSPYPR